MLQHKTNEHGNIWMDVKHLSSAPWLRPTKPLRNLRVRQFWPSMRTVHGLGRLSLEITGPASWSWVLPALSTRAQDFLSLANLSPRACHSGMYLGKPVLFFLLGDKVLSSKDSLSFLQTLEGPCTCLSGFTDLDVPTKWCPGPCAHKSLILNNGLGWLRPGSCHACSSQLQWPCSPTSSICTRADQKE